MTQTGQGLDGGRGAASSPFDVCHVGVVLRVVMGVQLAVALGVAFVAASPVDALNRWMQATAVSLPASLLWLVAACAVRAWLGRASDVGQWAFAMALGAACGVLGQIQMAWLDRALSGGAMVWEELCGNQLWGLIQGMCFHQMI